jgi:hypothetical protein
MLKSFFCKTEKTLRVPNSGCAQACFEREMTPHEKTLLHNALHETKTLNFSRAGIHRVFLGFHTFGNFFRYCPGLLLAVQVNSSGFRW